MDNPYQPLVETQERFTRAERLHAEHRTSGSKFWHELDFDERAVWVLAAYQERRAEAAEAARLKLERQLHQHFGTAEVDLIARRHAELRFEARYKK